jgi:hypothetical protein
VKIIGSDYKPTVEDLKELLKKIPDLYIPDCLKKEIDEPDRILWLGNTIYLKQKTGTSWDEIKDLDGDKLAGILFSI